MNVKEILESKDSIAELISKSMPINTAFKISKLQIEMNIILETFDDRRKKLFDKYGTKQEGKEEEMIIPTDNIPMYSKDMEDILNQNIDIKFEQIDIKDVGSIKIAPAHLTNINWLFKD